MDSHVYDFEMFTLDVSGKRGRAGSWPFHQMLVQDSQNRKHRDISFTLH
jgi:hypothetical protein